MVNPDSLGGSVVRWAEREPSVQALVLIGSQVHAGAAGPTGPDRHSDWDFQIITTQPENFAERAWMRELGAGEPLAYVARLGRLGSAIKATAVLAGGEMDFVVIPAAQLRAIGQQVKSRRHTENAQTMQALTDLAAVLLSGYRMLKGADEFGELYQFVRREIPLPRLSDDDVRRLAEGFVCDYVSLRRRIDRGELLAAQRGLHGQLGETNFRLLHEWRQRAGAKSFPDARRIETLAEPRHSAVSIEAIPAADSLRMAAEKSAYACRELVSALLDNGWRWPEAIR